MINEFCTQVTCSSSTGGSSSSSTGSSSISRPSSNGGDLCVQLSL